MSNHVQGVVRPRRKAILSVLGLSMAAAIGLATDAMAGQQCWGSGSERHCRDVRSDGSAPAGYRAAERTGVNRNDPAMGSGGGTYKPMYSNPGRLSPLPLPK